MKQRERNVAWDEDFWVDSPMSGTLHSLNYEPPEAPPVILVPDGAGDYREHQVISRPRGKIGF